jgi:hypothetical protein
VDGGRIVGQDFRAQARHAVCGGQFHQHGHQRLAHALVLPVIDHGDGEFRVHAAARAHEARHAHARAPRGHGAPGDMKALVDVQQIVEFRRGECGLRLMEARAARFVRQAREGLQVVGAVAMPQRAQDDARAVDQPHTLLAAAQPARRAAAPLRAPAPQRGADQLHLE